MEAAMDVEQVVHRIVGNVSPAAAANMRRGALLEDELKLSSLDFAEISFELEDHFGIKIEMNSNLVSTLRTIDDIVQMVSDLVARKAQA
jgi:acyl carrier protein